jgi:hypothetical protein
MLQIDHHTDPKKILTIGCRSLVLFVLFALLAGCSVDENIVKECGQNHPNSLWGQFLCQNKKDSEVAEFKKQLRLAREAEIRKQCASNFINSDFPDKAKVIYEFVKNDFDKDFKFVSKKLISELNLEAGDEYTKGHGSASTFEQAYRQRKYGDAPFKSVDFLFKNQCNLKHLVGVTSIDFDNAGNLISMDIHSQWQSADGKIVKKELKDFTHPKYGNPAKNKRILGENFSLISVLENRFGKYDRSEGCFYFSPRQVLGAQELKQILRGLTFEDTIWDDEQKFCLVIDNSSLKKTGKDQELSIILTGSSIGDRAGRFVPGIVSAHTFLIQSSGYTEKAQSFLALGSFWTAPVGWESIEFSKSGPTGWINKYKHCAQGCTDYVTFLVTENNKFWITDFKASSWDGNEATDKNFFKIQYALVNDDFSDRKFPLRLELKGMKAGAPIDRSILVEFDPIKKQYVIPQKFYPSGLN